jgi:hypothetical protein
MEVSEKAYLSSIPEESQKSKQRKNMKLFRLGLRKMERLATRDIDGKD